MPKDKDPEKHRQQVISNIRCLYPPDSDFAFDDNLPTHPGPELLWRAICMRWDALPIEILTALSGLNERQERLQQEKDRKRMRGLY